VISAVLQIDRIGNNRDRTWGMLAQARKKFRVRGPDRAANRSGGWFWVRACDAGATCDKDELSLSHGFLRGLG